MRTKVRRTYRWIEEAARRGTVALRPLPDFLIIGAMKAGTTALYSYVTALPGVVPARSKEVQFFSYHWQRGEHWYRSNFPIKSRKDVTGEASPSYLFHPHAAERAAATVPEARLVALLRNPIDRAYSHYAHWVARGWEGLSFDDALEAEEHRLAGATGKVFDAPHNAYMLYSYKRRGHYAEQLGQWFSFFGRDGVLVIQSERLAEAPQHVVPRVAEWLGVRKDYRLPYRRENVAPYREDLSPSVRGKLREYFAPHNERLYELIGEDFKWA